MSGVMRQQVKCRLDALFNASAELSPADATREVTGLALDTRLLLAGDLYLALPGRVTHGLHHVQSAIDAGAAAIAATPADWQAHPEAIEQVRAASVAAVQASDLHGRVVAIADIFYKRDKGAARLIAVTGTDGKTSVCRYVSDALSACGHPCGYIGTVGWGLGEQVGDNALTTPDIVEMRRMLFDLAAAGATHVAFEASSHALVEGRLQGLDISIAALTNVGRDHLDYHETIEAYRAAKASLFHWPSLEACVLNVGDDLGSELAGTIEELAKVGQKSGKAVQVYRYQSESANAGQTCKGDQPAFVVAENIQANADGLAFTLCDGEQRFDVGSGLYGRFNVENLLACHGVLRACGLAANEAVHALEHVQGVAGRMEIFRAAADSTQPTVVVDYAHTPQSLAAVIAAVRVHCKADLWVVFGCGGDRDPGKRAPMARAAAAADHIIVTDDNPRSEPSQAIIDDILEGFTAADNVQVVAEREAAIRLAMSKAGTDDMVLIAGKGHEDYQIVGSQRRHFSDRETVAMLLREAS